MIESPQYNNPWAEKLSQVSLPDTGTAWLAMEALLDKEMPTGWRRDRRRWLLLILLLLLLIGVCNCPGRGHFSAITSRWSKAFQTVPADDKIAHGPSPVAGEGRTPPTGGTRTPGGPSTPPGGVTTGVVTSPADTPDNHHRLPSGPKGTTTVGSPKAGSSKAGSPKAETPQAGIPGANSPGTDSPGTGSPGVTSPSKHAAVPVAGPPGSTTTAAPKKDSLTMPARKPVVKDSTHKKPPAPPAEKPEEEKDHGWVVGIGLNQFFPVGGQRGSTYNSDGLTGTLSDYLPVPMIRYYFNQKAYVQVEVQLNTPQPTKKNLVFNSPLPDTVTQPGNSIITSATIQQLYYFNIPLSFHYALTDNLNIGTGLQFSHLSNAIGNFDSTITNTSTLAATNAKDTKSFKGDSLYRRIKTNEFRFLVDVNYTYKHFVLGLRYNQALSNFINVQLPTGGTTQSRNSSLQLYLRYILWDSRKKKSSLPAK